MGTIAVNLQERSNRVVELAHAFELAAQNHKWDEVAGILPQLMQHIGASTEYLAGIDTKLAITSAETLAKIVENIEAVLGLKDDADTDNLTENGAQVEGSGGSVAEEPTI